MTSNRVREIVALWLIGFLGPENRCFLTALGWADPVAHGSMSPLLGPVVGLLLKHPGAEIGSLKVERSRLGFAVCHVSLRYPDSKCRYWYECVQGPDQPVLPWRFIGGDLPA